MDIKFAEVIYASSLGECAIRDDYSGRRMYGSTTTGIVCSSGVSGFVKSCIAATLDEPEIMEEMLFKDICYDSMGLNTIFY